MHLLRRPARTFLAALFSGFLPGLALAAQDRAARRPVHTYSIVARDPKTGDLGVAVQSHWFSVGSVVTWAEAGVGAVATQSFSDPRYGALGLEMMRAGHRAPDVLKGLVAADEGREVRQVGMVDAGGKVAAHTGSLCIDAAGHETGEGFSVQANLMDRDTVWPAMARAYREALKDPKLDLADRLMAALRAAQAEGGDIRGQQSAALLVVKARPSGRPWEDRIFDLRVEDHPDPLGELSRLLKLGRAYAFMNEGDGHVTAGRWEEARTAYARAAALAPGVVEMPFWHAVALASSGKVEESLPLFRRVFAAEPLWRRLVPRLVKAGQLPKDPAVAERILGP